MRFCISQILLLIRLLSAAANGEKCKPSGKIRGKKPPKDKCNRENNSECCEQGKLYTTYQCSRRCWRWTALRRAGTAAGGFKTKVVALSTTWRGATRLLRSKATGGAQRPRWWTSATPPSGVTTSTTISHRSRTTSWMLLRQCGRRWVCRRMREVGWKFCGLM